MIMAMVTGMVVCVGSLKCVVVLQIHPDRLRMMGRSAQPSVNQDSNGQAVSSAELATDVLC